jgi:hypothetical protein
MSQFLIRNGPDNPNIYPNKQRFSVLYSKRLTLCTLSTSKMLTLLVRKGSKSANTESMRVSPYTDNKQI